MLAVAIFLLAAILYEPGNLMDVLNLQGTLSEASVVLIGLYFAGTLALVGARAVFSRRRTEAS